MGSGGDDHGHGHGRGQGRGHGHHDAKGGSKNDGHHSDGGNNSSSRGHGGHGSRSSTYMTAERASAIQSHADRTGRNEDFKERAMSAADRHENDGDFDNEDD